MKNNAPVMLRQPYAEARVGSDWVALLKDGYQAYPAMLEAIAAAKDSICLETYILKDDGVGMRFLAVLMEKARTGVEVLLMFDYWGSEISDATLRELQTAGVKLHVFRPWKYWGSLSRALAKMSRRNHRKALIVDGIVGFTGGLNISNQYAARVDGGEGWRDTHLRISGPGALGLERLFLRTWAQNKGPAFDAKRFERPRAVPNDQLRVVGNDFALDRKDIRRAYQSAFSKATSRIFVTNAYFLPPVKMLKALAAAARRGVRVCVIVAATTDVKLVLYAARGLYPRLLKSGIEVYEWAAGRILHAKTAVVDGTWATVGSSNLDQLSMRQNLEVNAIVEERTFGAALEKMFLEDLEQCRQISLSEVQRYGLIQRLLSWVALRLRHWL